MGRKKCPSGSSKVKDRVVDGERRRRGDSMFGARGGVDDRVAEGERAAGRFARGA